MTGDPLCGVTVFNPATAAWLADADISAADSGVQIIVRGLSAAHRKNWTLWKRKKLILVGVTTDLAGSDLSDQSLPHAGHWVVIAAIIGGMPWLGRSGNVEGNYGKPHKTPTHIAGNQRTICRSSSRVSLNCSPVRRQYISARDTIVVKNPLGKTLETPEAGDREQSALTCRDIFAPVIESSLGQPPLPASFPEALRHDQARRLYLQGGGTILDRACNELEAFQAAYALAPDNLL